VKLAEAQGAELESWAIIAPEGVVECPQIALPEIGESRYTLALFVFQKKGHGEKRMLWRNRNEEARQTWLRGALARIPPGARILDAGAGELANKPLCRHLQYVSQDFCQYDGQGNREGLQSGRWDTGRVDIVSDITAIPESDASFEAILCSEVLEHIPEPTKALDEFSRLLKPGGTLILTAPFASLVHMAPYHYVTGFSRYWYEYHFPRRGFEIVELTANGDWFAYCEQELRRLGFMARRTGDWAWPLAYALGVMGSVYFRLRRETGAEDVACFGWHCIAAKK
jgi:ubiquinone/menaquinone biosynthesis C-methylase UbiE